MTNLQRSHPRPAKEQLDVEAITDASPAHTEAKPRRRHRIGLLAVLVIVLVTALAWTLLSRVQTADQAAADARPPAPSLVTAPVEQRVLSQTVILRGNVVPQDNTNISLPTVSEGAASVTGMFVDAGDLAASGTALLEVSGRPIFVVEGRVPAYRTMRPGSTGPDIDQLNQALTVLGYQPNTDATFGSATKIALEAFYQDRGYDPVPASPTTDVDRASLQSELAAAEVTLTETQTKLDNVIRWRSRQTTIDSATQIRDAALAARDALALRLFTLDITSGPLVPLGEIQFVPQPEVRIDAINVTVGSQPNADKPVVTVSVGDLVVDSVVTVNNRSLVNVGAEATILNESTGEEYAAAVSAIANEAVSGTEGQTGFATIVTPKQALPAGMLRANVRITITAAQTENEVLVVPLIAVTSNADGSTSIDVLKTDTEEPTAVEVTTGLMADGMVEITPRTADEITPGVQVVIGQ